MDLNSKTYFKLIELHYKEVDSRKYTKIVDALCSLIERRDHEIPKM
jgi:hypothetical protein